MQSTGSPPKSAEWHHLKNMKKTCFFQFPFGFVASRRNAASKCGVSRKCGRGKCGVKKCGVKHCGLPANLPSTMNSEPGTKVLMMNCPDRPEIPKHPMFENCYNNINKNSPHRCFLSWTSVFLMPRPTLRGVACDRNFWSLVTAIFGRLWPHELLRCHFSRQAQYLVMLECHFSWQAHYLVMLEGQFFWQAQHLVKFGTVLE